MDTWAPACSLTALRQRARLLAAIRKFFDSRGVLEVETPLLCHAGSTDPHLLSFTSEFRQPGASHGVELYLQTSPEFAMKRLLAAGAGSIYQICKAFRNEEAGRHHNPEFTLLEWYRVGFSLFDLIDDIDALLLAIGDAALSLAPSERLVYADIFERHVGVHPLTATLADFAAISRARDFPEAASLCGEDRNVWLDVLFGQYVQPHLGLGRISYVYDYPACLPSLARRSPQDARVVERVEVFLGGLELGNGFHELADAEEQAARFERDLAERRALGLPLPPRDDRLLAALAAGLPDCSGVAIGLDRLLMLLTRAGSLADVVAFPIYRA